MTASSPSSSRHIFPGMRVVDREVPDGDPAVEYTAKYAMCRLAVRDSRHPAVRAIAARLKAGKSDEQAARAAFEYVVRTIRYVKDPRGIELVTAPVYLLRAIPIPGYSPIGDCDCMCAALAALILAMGYRISFRPLAWYEVAFTHVNPRITLPSGKVIPCDPVAGLAGWNWEKSEIIREKDYECSAMIVRTLEDRVGPAPASQPISQTARSAARYGMGRPPMARALARFLLGRAGGNAHERTLGDCGCGCGGKCGGRKKCCQGQHSHSASDTGPITVNVSPNFGTQTRYADASWRLYNAPSDRRSAWFNAQESLSPVTAAPAVEPRVIERVRNVPTPVAVPGPVVAKEVPVLVEAQPAPPSDGPIYKEFY